MIKVGVYFVFQRRGHRGQDSNMGQTDTHKINGDCKKAEAKSWTFLNTFGLFQSW